jgi:hypothetical protein
MLANATDELMDIRASGRTVALPLLMRNLKPLIGFSAKRRTHSAKSMIGNAAPMRDNISYLLHFENGVSCFVACATREPQSFE